MRQGLKGHKKLASWVSLFFQDYRRWQSVAQTLPISIPNQPITLLQIVMKLLLQVAPKKWFPLSALTIPIHKEEATGQSQRTLITLFAKFPLWEQKESPNLILNFLKFVTNISCATSHMKLQTLLGFLSFQILFHTKDSSISTNPPNWL